MSYDNLGSGLAGLFKAGLWMIVISVPLALWKVIDIIIWLYKHITIQWG